MACSTIAFPAPSVHPTLSLIASGLLPACGFTTSILCVTAPIPSAGTSAPLAGASRSVIVLGTAACSEN